MKLFGLFLFNGLAVLAVVDLATPGLLRNGGLLEGKSECLPAVVASCRGASVVSNTVSRAMMVVFRKAGAAAVVDRPPPPRPEPLGVVLSGGILGSMVETGLAVKASSGLLVAAGLPLSLIHS